jgi:hypothetical protein
MAANDADVCVTRISRAPSPAARPAQPRAQPSRAIGQVGVLIANQQRCDLDLDVGHAQQHTDAEIAVDCGLGG